MDHMGDYLIPFILCGIVLYAATCGVDVFSVFVKGAKKGLSTAMRILPSLIALTTSVGMLKASGALDVLTFGLTPLANLLTIPREILPLALLRPISGSSAMVIFQDVLKTYHPDSYIGLVASVLMGSTETTFYTIAIYYGATHVKDTRHSLVCSLTADIVGFVVSAWVVRLLFGI